MSKETTTTWEQGCYIDGTWGRFGLTVLIALAETAGFPVEPSVRPAIAAYVNNNCTDDDYELVNVWAFHAEEWLNRNIAEDEEMFGWHEGEFFLWPLTTWRENDTDPEVDAHRNEVTA